MVDPQEIQQPSLSRSGIYYATGTMPLRRLVGTMSLWENSWPGTNSFACEPAEPVTLETLSSLAKRFQKWLTEAEKDLLRCWNAKPTQEGIAACVKRDQLTALAFRSLPILSVRFDRRVPRWRQGRWRSVT
jgi:hypothetical protein